jgi:putative ABC transport system substrate-binding protein
MNRRRLLLAIGALCAAPRVPAQPAGAPKRMAILSVGTAEAQRPFAAIFRSRMAQLGWQEGSNLVVVEALAGSNPGRLDALAQELAAQKVDVIYAVFPAAVRAARKAAPDTPIVFSIVSDPVGDGFAASLARPGGNITGTSTREVELWPKRVQLVKEMLPRAKRVIVLLDKQPPGASPYVPPYIASGLQDLGAAAKNLGIATVNRDIGSVDDVGPAFERMARERADAAIVMVYQRLQGAERRILTEHAARRRIPAIYGVTSYTDLGGLVSYSIDSAELLRRSADYVDKILRGAKPADLPIEEPRAFELVLNLKAAREQGIRFPQSMRLRADRLIE